MWRWLVLVACASPPAPVVTKPVEKRHVELDPPTTFPRLPRTIEPRAYRAHLAFVDNAIGGHIELDGDVAEATPAIWLHAQDVHVVRATASNGTRTVELDPTVAAWSVMNEIVGLRADPPLAAGRWTIAIDYGARIRMQDLTDRYTVSVEQAAGAFRDADRRFLYTMSEPMYARRIFPCVDEPDRKVPWQLTLDVRDDDVAVSNTPVVRESPLPDHHKRVEFAPTPPLPSYLIAFAVGPFDVVDAGHTRTGTSIRYVVQPGTKISVDNTAQIVEAVEDWFGQPYPFAKLDFVAMTKTNERYVAMENPGMITVRADLLADSDRWVYTVTHELAHQWFGNLVTPAWWDDIWLNESFATWLGTHLTATLRGDDPGAATIDLVMSADEPNRVRPSMKNTGTADELADYFHGRRGAAVLEMVSSYVGDDVLRRAIQTYVTEHAGGVVTTADFIAALDATTGQHLDGVVSSYVDSWLAPTVETQLTCTKGAATIKLHVDSDAPIPTCVVYDRDGSRALACAIVDHGVEVALPAKRCPKWAYANGNGTGMYTVAWHGSARQDLVDHAWPSLVPAERARLRDELLVDPETGIPNLARLLDDRDWQSRRTMLSALARYATYVPDDLRGAFDAWVQQHFPMPHLAIAEDAPYGDRVVGRYSLWLLAVAHDRALTHEAQSFSPTFDGLPYDLRSAAMTMAANSDVGIAELLLDRLDDPPVAAALGRTPNLIDALARHPDKLAARRLVERIDLLASTCDAAHRDIAVKLAASSLDELSAEQVTARIDDCLAKKKALDPVFRRWLGH